MFFGSVAEMKGNEARVVLFLHPVKEFKEGKVSEAKPKSMLSRFPSILRILGTVLALGMVTYVLYFSSATVFPLETTTTDPPITPNTTNAHTQETLISTTEQPTNTTMTTDGAAANSTTMHSTSTTKSTSTLTSVEITLTPGIQKHFVTLLWRHYSGAESDPFDVSTLYLYGLVASSSLLMAYIAVLFASQKDLWARVVQAWRRARGKPPGEEMHILHTLPYYLAITRSSCEVNDSAHFYVPRVKFKNNHPTLPYPRLVSYPQDTFPTITFFYGSPQAHILNLPVGHKPPTAAKDSVKLDVKLELGDTRARWKSVVGIIDLV